MDEIDRTRALIDVVEGSQGPTGRVNPATVAADNSAKAAAAAVATGAAQVALDRADVAEKAAQVAQQFQQLLEVVGQIIGFDARLTAEAASRQAGDVALGGRIDTAEQRARDALVRTATALSRDLADLVASAETGLVSRIAVREQVLLHTIQRGLSAAARDTEALVASAEAIGRDQLAARERMILTTLRAGLVSAAADLADLVASAEAGLTARFSTLIAAREQALLTSMGSMARTLAAEAQDASRPALRVLYDSTGQTGLAVPDDPDVLHLFWVGGQSLALGATDGAPISTTALYPTRALMPLGGTHTYGTVTRLVPIIETPFLTTIGETVAASTLNHLIRDLDAVAPSKVSRFAAFVCAQGATNLYGLKRGSTPYAQGLAAIRSIARLEGAQGRRVIVHIIWIQGENDQNTPGYAKELVRLQADAAVDLADATGQREEPVLFVVQTRAVPAGQAAVGPNVSREQLRAMDAAPGRIVVCGPMYESDCNAADHIHDTSLGAYKKGPMIARAIRETLFGRGWRPTRITRARFTTPPAGVAASILCDVAVPSGSLAKDTSGGIMTVGGMASAATGGLDVYNDDGSPITVTATTVTRATTDATTLAPPQIRVDLAALPTTPEVVLTIGGRRDSAAAGTDDGPITGARTLFRAGSGVARLGVDGSGSGTGAGPSYDWLCQDGLTISAGPYVAAPTA